MPEVDDKCAESLFVSCVLHQSMMKNFHKLARHDCCDEVVRKKTISQERSQSDLDFVRVAEVQFSPVNPPLGENLELDLNLRGYLVENHEPELQNRFYKVQSAVRAGSDLIKKKENSRGITSAAAGTFSTTLRCSVILSYYSEQSAYISHYQLAQMVSSRVLQPRPQL